MSEPLEMNVEFETSDTEMNMEADMNCNIEVPLPIASATQLGGIKVGENLSIAPDGTLSAEGSSVVVDDTLAISGAAADAKKTGDEISGLKEDLTKVENITYTQTEIAPFSSPNDWKLNPDTGIGVLDTNYKLIKFNVTPGAFLKIVSSYNFQFQSAQGVPSGGTSTRIGVTYGSGEYFLTVPDNGNYLIMSALKTSTTDHVYTLANRLDIVEQDLDGLKDNVESIEGALPKVTSYITVIDADTEGWETGYYYIGAVGATVAKTAYAGTSCRVYGPVKKDDVFNLNARSVGSAYAIILCDANNKVIQNYASTSGTSYYNAENYTVPQDGIMYLNTITADYLSGNKLYFFKKGEKTYQSLKSVLNGIKWYSIGDSLNEFNNTAETNWIQYLINSTGVNNVNVAKSGSGFYRGAPLEGQTQINYIKQLDAVGDDAELITIAGSLNDLMPSPWTTLPVGTATDSGTSTIAGYMNTFFDALLARFPTVPIAVVMTSPWDVFKPGVSTSDSYASVLKTICQTRGIPFCDDCYYGCNLKPWISDNKTEYYTRTSGYVDGVHPNSKGHVFIYRMLKPFIEKVVYAIS